MINNTDVNKIISYTMPHKLKITVRREKVRFNSHLEGES